MSKIHDAEEKLIEADNKEAAETLETFEMRWKYAVFPAMFAFAILSAFGFYLIYGMLQRMEDLSENVYKMTETIQASMPAMKSNMDSMSADIHQMSGTIQEEFPKLDERILTMTSDMRTMSYSTASMAATTHNMSQNVWELNKNVSKPLSVMNNMLPWTKKGTIPPPPKPYYANQQRTY